MEIYLFYLLIAILLFYKPSFVNKNVLFSQKDTKVLKGVCALIIITHHLGIQYVLNDILDINTDMGGIGVGIFFLLSAYGLLKTSQKNNFNYIKRLLNKAFVLYLTQISINIIYYLIYSPAGDFGRILLQILDFGFFIGLPILNGYSWFITTILIIYLMYAVVLSIAKIKNIENKKLFICVAWTILVLMYYYSNIFIPFNTLYLRSLWCFVFGIWVYYFEELIIKILSRKTLYVLVLIGSLGLVIFTNRFMGENPVSISWCLLIVVISRYISFENNNIALILGEISLEIYLFQLIFIQHLNASMGIVIYGIALISSTIIISFIFHELKKQLTKLILLCKQKFTKTEYKPKGVASN